MIIAVVTTHFAVGRCTASALPNHGSHLVLGVVACRGRYQTIVVTKRWFVRESAVCHQRICVLSSRHQAGAWGRASVLTWAAQLHTDRLLAVIPSAEVQPPWRQYGLHHHYPN